MDVKITDYGNDGENYFVYYEVIGLSLNQMEYLNDNMEEETEIEGDIFKIAMFFDEELYPFQSEAAKFRMDDFRGREEIEMNVFLSSFLEDM